MDIQFLPDETYILIFDMVELQKAFNGVQSVMLL